MIMPFGKHRGEDLEDIPLSYLEWALKNCKGLSTNLKKEMQRLTSGDGSRSAQRGGASRSAQRGESSKGVTKKTVDEWYRRLAREFHPDKGGSHEAMKAINRGHDLLRELIK